MLYFQQLRPPAKVLQMLEVSVHLIASRFAGYARDMLGQPYIPPGNPGRVLASYMIVKRH